MKTPEPKAFGWGIFSSQGLIVSSIRGTKSKAQRDMAEQAVTSWPSLYRFGWRCRKVWIRCNEPSPACKSGGKSTKVQP